LSIRKKINILNRVLGDGYNSNTERLYFCPNCDHHKKKLSVNIEKNLFKCWVCDWSGRDVYRIIRRCGTNSQKNEWKSLSSTIAIERFAEKLFAEEEQEREETVDLPEEFISLVNKNLPPTSRYPLNYLYSRGIGKKDIIRWKMGYCSKGDFSGRVIIPSFGLTGDPNYFIARTYSGDWKKYLNPRVSKDMIFNQLYLDFDQDLVLVEGVFDAVVAGPNAVPLLGSTLREGARLFQEIVKNDTPVYLALDSDAKKKTIQIARSFIKYDIEVYQVDVSPYKDVGEMPKSEFLDRKKSAKKLTMQRCLQDAIMNI
jgi:DNA primase